MTYSEINTLARELAFLVMWLTRPTSFRSQATSSAVSAWMGEPPTRYSRLNMANMEFLSLINQKLKQILKVDNTQTDR